MIEIELNNVKKNYGLKNVLDGISFEIKTGERVALIGNNGSGKSTVLKIIAGEENLDFGKVNIRKNSKIGYLKQIYENEKENMLVKEFLYQSFIELINIEKVLLDLENKMCLETNEDNLNKLAIKYGNIQDEYILKGGYDIKEKFGRICSGFKFKDEFLNQEYNKLSGGEKTIVNLARLLLKNPSILLLDEPTNHLDEDRLMWLEEYLKSYNGTILIVSHDRYFLDKVVNKIILVERGKEKIYFCNYSYFVEEDERRTLAEFEIYKNQQKQIEKMKEAIKKLRKFGEKEENESFYKRAKCIEKRLEKMELVEKVSLDKGKSRINIKFDVTERSGKDVVTIQNLNKSFGDKIIFKDLNFSIFYGEKILLKGKNGTGKSTLLKTILGEDKNYSGNVKIGTNVKIGFIPQIIQFDENENIYEYFYKIHKGSETDIRTYLAKFMFFGENVFKKLNSLSGGEKVRIKLAELMLKNINFLILDEPTNHLDINTRELLEETLKEFKGTILFVSHDRYFTNKIAEKICTVENFTLDIKTKL